MLSSLEGPPRSSANGYLLRFPILRHQYIHRQRFSPHHIFIRQNLAALPHRQGGTTYTNLD